MGNLFDLHIAERDHIIMPYSINWCIAIFFPNGLGILADSSFLIWLKNHLSFSVQPSYFQSSFYQADNLFAISSLIFEVEGSAQYLC